MTRNEINDIKNLCFASIDIAILMKARGRTLLDIKDYVGEEIDNIFKTDKQKVIESGRY